MPRAGFHNDNEYRAYPFVFKTKYESAVELPTSAIVDCGFIMGLDSEYAAHEHSAYLYSMTRTTDAVEFVFKTNAPGAEEFPISFQCAIGSEEWQTYFAESSVNSANNFCATEPAWEGFIVVGKFEEILELLPTPGTIYFYTPEDFTDDTPDYLVEPARIQSLVMAYVRSISVGNYERPRVPACEELGSSSSATANERQIIVNAQCLSGNIKLKPGYNCAITQVVNANTLTVTAFKRDNGVEDETAEICQYGSELPLYAGQTPAEGEVFLSGGPACDDLITSINGIGGPNVNIAADAGIQIVPDGDNSIKIDVTPNIIQQNCG